APRLDRAHPEEGAAAAGGTPDGCPGSAAGAGPAGDRRALGSPLSRGGSPRRTADGTDARPAPAGGGVHPGSRGLSSRAQSVAAPPGPAAPGSLAGAGRRGNGAPVSAGRDPLPENPLGQLLEPGNDQPERESVVPAPGAGASPAGPRALPHRPPEPLARLLGAGPAP